MAYPMTNRLAKETFPLGLCRGAAKSIKCNPKNIEFFWYGFWNRVAHQITHRISVGPFVVCPQYPLWRLNIEEEVDPNAVFTLTGQEEDQNQGYEPMDVDSQSSASGGVSFNSEDLANIGKNRQKITDFALVFWKGTEETGTGLDEWAEEWNIDEQFVAVLIEVKRFCPRNLEIGSEERKHALDKIMDEAKKGVLKQALYHFASPQGKDQESIFLIAAVGDMFCYTVISNTKTWVRAVTQNVDKDNLAYDPRVPDRSEFAMELWSKRATWGKEKNQKKMNAVTDWLGLYMTEREMVPKRTKAQGSRR